MDSLQIRAIEHHKTGGFIMPEGLRRKDQPGRIRGEVPGEQVPLQGAADGCKLD